MVGRRDRASAEPMVDLSYRQSAGRREAAAVLQAPYLCASVEFLMAVADFFLKALPPRPAPSAPLRPTAGPRPEAQTGETQTPTLWTRPTRRRSTGAGPHGQEPG